MRFLELAPLFIILIFKSFSHKILLLSPISYNIVRFFLRKDFVMTPDQQIIFTYIIIFAAILTPIALVILGSILNNHKKKYPSCY